MQQDHKLHQRQQVGSLRRGPNREALWIIHRPVPAEKSHKTPIDRGIRGGSAARQAAADTREHPSSTIRRYKSAEQPPQRIETLLHFPAGLQPARSKPLQKAHSTRRLAVDVHRAPSPHNVAPALGRNNIHLKNVAHALMATFPMNREVPGGDHQVPSADVTGVTINADLAVMRWEHKERVALAVRKFKQAASKIVLGQSTSAPPLSTHPSPLSGSNSPLVRKSNPKWSLIKNSLAPSIGVCLTEAFGAGPVCGDT
ncbi:hypothetical protein T484DRAFT_1820859 [Baffinella frigidus]|nr:hypothetical protein T484DRAFT_1820859 [Cryptophyta sp. CCMP2293]